MSSDTTANRVLLTETNDPNAGNLSPSKTPNISETPRPDNIPQYEDPYERAVTYMEKHRILHTFRVSYFFYFFVL